MVLLGCLLLSFSAASALAFNADDLAAEKSKAQSGNVMSQVNVGDHYYARSQYAEALKWYQMAAKQGQFDSRSRIAHMYVHGEGMPKDLVKGYVLYVKIMQNHVLYPESQQAYEKYVKELALQLTPEQMAEAEKRIAQPWQF